jgi:hypothetical protein
LGREGRRADREEADVQQEVAREVFLGLPQLNREVGVAAINNVNVGGCTAAI